MGIVNTERLGIPGGRPGWGKDTFVTSSSRGNKDVRCSHDDDDDLDDDSDDQKHTSEIYATSMSLVSPSNFSTFSLLGYCPAPLIK